MRALLNRRPLIGLSVLAVLLFSGCVAVNRTPPLSDNSQSPAAVYHGVAFTTGTFKRPHRTIGVVQMTQEGFRNYLAGEVNLEGTDNEQMMQAIAYYVAQQGADGIQGFSLIAQNPRSREERGVQQMGQAAKIAVAILEKHPEGGVAAAEGETTRFFVKGELIKWDQSAPSSPSPVPTPALDELTE